VAVFLNSAAHFSCLLFAGTTFGGFASVKVFSEPDLQVLEMLN
jgi:hypothetical protein